MSHLPTSTPLRSQSTTALHKDYEAVHVLLLKFKYDDLSLSTELTKLESTYSQLGYTVSRFDIGMKDEWKPRKLKRRLNKFLKRARNKNILSIIHYSGHGGCEKNDGGKGFYLSSHNWPRDAESVMRAVGTVWRDGRLGSGDGFEEALRRNKNPFQPVAGIYWSDLSPTIMSAESDTLIILDCCCAGLATISSQHPGGLGDNMETVSNYRKELIGACGWLVDTYGDMSDALCSALQRGLPNWNRTISTHTLVRLTNNRLVQLFNTRQEGQEPPQAVHYLLQRNNKNKMILPRFERRRERERERSPPIMRVSSSSVNRSLIRCVKRRRQDESDLLQREEEVREWVEGNDESVLPDAADYNPSQGGETRGFQRQGTSPPEVQEGSDSGMAMTVDENNLMQKQAINAVLANIMIPSGTVATTQTITTTTTQDEILFQAPGHSDGFDVDFEGGLSLNWDPNALALGVDYDYDLQLIMGETNTSHQTPKGQLLTDQQPLRSSTDKYPDHPWLSPTPPPGT
ncbi:hypothetical protein QBC38DRAFT_451255 [Podospora fimiseda]|uniref:Caspase domain-containing protein n=1 Tax=Podospora fimiseda TaxID=252190 RepID=A0AAN7BXU5_9PEZI|nr:hypothetical protein QBC38DRAFT_451255 [Podospora fimiseda]